MSGFTIPKDTVVYGVARYIMRDPDHWEKPEEFNPGRFIQTDPNTSESSLRKEERMIPFGIGVFACTKKSATIGY